MPEVNLTVRNSRRTIEALQSVVESAHLTEDSAVLLGELLANLNAAVIEAEERNQFNRTWEAFAGNYVFDDDEERHHQLTGFTEGWVAARRTAGLPTQFASATQPTEAGPSDG